MTKFRFEMNVEEQNKIAAEAAEQFAKAMGGDNHGQEALIAVIKSSIEKAVKAENKRMTEFSQGQRDIAFRQGQESRAARANKKPLLGSKQCPAPENELGDSSGDSYRHPTMNEILKEMNKELTKFAEETWAALIKRMNGIPARLHADCINIIKSSIEEAVRIAQQETATLELERYRAIEKCMISATRRGRKAAIQKAYDSGYEHGAKDQRAGDRAAHASDGGVNPETGETWAAHASEDK